jgi:hypothetical protein
MVDINITLYVAIADWEVYSQNQEVLHDKVGEAFERELFRIKESLAKAGGVAPIVETLQEEAVHKKMAARRVIEASERLYKDELRHNNGRKGGLV